MAGPTKNSEGGKKMSKNEIPKQDPKQKKGLTNALKYFFDRILVETDAPLICSYE